MSLKQPAGNFRGPGCFVVLTFSKDVRVISKDGGSSLPGALVSTLWKPYSVERCGGKYIVSLQIVCFSFKRLYSAFLMHMSTHLDDVYISWAFVYHGVVHSHQYTLCTIHLPVLLNFSASPSKRKPSQSYITLNRFKGEMSSATVPHKDNWISISRKGGRPTFGAHYITDSRNSPLSRWLAESTQYSPWNGIDAVRQEAQITVHRRSARTPSSNNATMGAS